jgi:hypothetical protein
VVTVREVVPVDVSTKALPAMEAGASTTGPGDLVEVLVKTEVPEPVDVK